MAQCPLQDLVVTAGGGIACCTIWETPRNPRRRRRVAGEILCAFETLAPGRVEHGDREGGAAGLVDGRGGR